MDTSRLFKCLDMNFFPIVGICWILNVQGTHNFLRFFRISNENVPSPQMQHALAYFNFIVPF